ncbi:MAG: hypothetical protein ABIP51_14115, partial [Bacteroidia bacterium]
MKVLKFIAFTFLLSITGRAQTKSPSFEKEFDDAEKIFSKISDSKSESLTSTKGAYAEVLPVFLNLYKQDPTNMNLAFKIGVCYQNARRERLKSIAYFSKAVTSVSNDYKGSSYKEKNAPLIAYKYLGDAYHWNYEFDKAIVAYKKYISVMEQNNAADITLLAETNRKIDMCNTGKRLVAAPIKIKIQNLSNTVNSPYADYSAIFSADQNTLFFTSRRPQTTGGEKDNEGNYMEDIYTSSKTKTGWSAAQNIGAPINTESHEATVGVSPDAQMILIYKDDMGDGNIYSTSLDGDVWTKPVKLNDNINTNHWEPSAFISADGNSLYFSSNKPGGFGGLDLYVSKRGSDGDWGKAINLGANINTTYDEDAPSIHPDGVTLSFSSNGHNTMGGFDIFTSLLSYDGNWSEPVNVGYPINTTDDDIFYMVSPNGKTAYFSSFREDGLGEKDNYMATFLERKETPLTLIQGTINDEAGMPAKKV